ncbi:2306_t:CDS:2 [Diversispora eburnea]|uniref:2306_t:CDS:1 n=1 Tax=Diversispora eburnea TaxID=1213867 RepID=A0A9N9AVY5_9GLOM|nr:2306_t:CDS:2 [Diversispora eburnea]
MKLFAVVSVALSLLSIINAAPVNLTKRRFGQEHTPLADKTYQDMKDAVAGTTFEQVTGDLSGEAVRALLARAPKCQQQDVADKCIDIAHQIGEEVSKDREATLIPVCQTYRKLERNTPNEGQPSELCDRPPRNKELEDDAVPNDNEAFNNPVGGVQMPLITKLSPGGPEGNFQVKDSKFQQEGAAHNRQCDVQHNACFDKFNAGDRSFQGSDCDEQNNVCKAGPPVFAA